MPAFITLLSLPPFITAIVLLIRNRSPLGWITWFPKLFGGALCVWMGLLGFVVGTIGIFVDAPVAAALGGVSFIVCGAYTLRVISVKAEFDRAFGPGWSRRIPQPVHTRLHRRRWSLVAPQAAKEPQVERDIPFWTIPGQYTTNGQPRTLLCDIWQPPDGVPASGLAFIYIHGSAWTLLDKDVGTSFFFRQLANQGHLIMDVAYRLFPETDIPGMVGDVKRSIAWMKDRCAAYGVQPDRIVIGGGSAGGHLSLLAAYAPNEALLTPGDLRGRDLSVCGVISEYGPTDLSACYYHTNQHKTTRSLPPGPPPPKPAPDRPNAMQRLMGGSYTRFHLENGASSGAFIQIIGAHPDERPESYACLSPVTYVHPGCPPTLQIQGEYDMITDAAATRLLHAELTQQGVPSLLVIYPQTDHGFDLALPAISPSAQCALYDIERFLGVLSGGQ